MNGSSPPGGSPPDSPENDLNIYYLLYLYLLAFCSLIFSIYMCIHNHRYPLPNPQLTSGDRRGQEPAPRGIGLVAAILASLHIFTSSSAGGLSAAFLASLPVSTFSKAGDRAAEERKGNTAECPICLTEFAEGETVRYLPNCGHRFHVKCVDAWFASHSTCPLCRSVISDKGPRPRPQPQPQRSVPPARQQPPPYSSSSSSCHGHTINMSRA